SRALPAFCFSDPPSCSSHPFLSFLTRRPPRATLFPYTTLFRFLHRRALARPLRPGGGALARWLRHRLPRRGFPHQGLPAAGRRRDRKSTRLNSSHVKISYAVLCLKKKRKPVHE